MHGGTAEEPRGPRFGAFGLRLVVIGALATTVGGCAFGDGHEQGHASPPGSGETLSEQTQQIRDGDPSALEEVVVIEVYFDGQWRTQCTGTALRNNVILTAQHCLGSPVSFWHSRLFELPGSSNPSAPQQWDWRVRTLGGGVAQVSNAIRLVEQNYPPQLRENDYWLTGLRDMTTLKSDAALLVLDRNLPFYADSTNHVRDISTFTSAQMDLSIHLCVGFGNNAGTAGSGTGAGTQRWGFVQVFQPTFHPADARYVQYFPNYNTPNGIIPMQGDSGGPCFHLHDGYWWQVASVHSYQNTTCPDCSQQHYAAQQTGAEIFRREARVQMDRWKGSGSWNFSAMPSDKKTTVPAFLTGGSPNWYVSGGELREDSNARGDAATFEGPLFLRDGIYANPQAQVRVRSSDDDAVGLVLRYYDPDHYYRAAFDEERRHLRIYKRSGGVTSVLAERAVAIDLSNSHLLVFKAWEGRLRATLTGSDVNASLTVTDNSEDALQSGRVGIYKWGLESARFDDFSVTPVLAAF